MVVRASRKVLFDKKNARWRRRAWNATPRVKAPGVTEGVVRTPLEYACVEPGYVPELPFPEHWRARRGRESQR